MTVGSSTRFFPRCARPIMAFGERRGRPFVGRTLSAFAPISIRLRNSTHNQTMGIRFQCPNGHKLNVKADLAGKRASCPECGVKLVIPAAAPWPVTAASGDRGRSGDAPGWPLVFADRRRRTVRSRDRSAIQGWNVTDASLRIRTYGVTDGPRGNSRATLQMFCRCRSRRFPSRQRESVVLPVVPRCSPRNWPSRSDCPDSDAASAVPGATSRCRAGK